MFLIWFGDGTLYTADGVWVETPNYDPLCGIFQVSMLEGWVKFRSDDATADQAESMMDRS